jgi:hypothetical protein
MWLNTRTSTDESKTRNLASITIADEMLLQFFRGKTDAFEVVSGGLPDDARIVSVTHDYQGLHLIVEGPGLPEVNEGGFAPPHDVWFRQATPTASEFFEEDR